MNWLAKHDKKKCFYPTHVKSMSNMNQMVKNLIPVDTNWSLSKIVNILGSSIKYKRLNNYRVNLY